MVSKLEMDTWKEMPSTFALRQTLLPTRQSASCIASVAESSLPPISVCLTVGWSSWYWHILRRSTSVRVFRGVLEVRPECVEVADTGVAETGVMGTGAEGKMGGT